MDDYKGIKYLQKKLEQKAHRVKLRYAYYEQKMETRDRGFLIPPWLKGQFHAIVGWNAKSVDTLADRLVFLGFEDGTDYFGAQQIFDLNNPDILFDAAIKESLIGSCSFVHITHGEGDERTPRLSVLTAKDATGVMDEFTGLLKEGYAVLDRDNGKPIIEAYFTPDGTQYFENGVATVFEENPGRYPLLVPIVYKPDSERPFGHSRISRSCMYLQQFAQSTLERAEVSSEFYSFPQKYVTGLDPDADPLDAWRASMSAMLRFDKDEDGDKPTLGQFTQQSMTPYTEQIRMAAAMFAGETGLTLDDLGFLTDNPSSAEAIKASHESLRLIARKAQRTYGTAFANVGYVAASLRDGQPYSRALVADCKAKWMPVFEPDAAAITSIADGALKVNQAIPNYFDRNNLADLIGIEAGEIETAEAIGVEE